MYICSANTIYGKCTKYDTKHGGETTEEKHDPKKKDAIPYLV